MKVKAYNNTVGAEVFLERQKAIPLARAQARHGLGIAYSNKDRSKRSNCIFSMCFAVGEIFSVQSNIPNILWQGIMFIYV